MAAHDDVSVVPGRAGGPARWAVVGRQVSGIVLLVVVPAHLALTRVFEDPARMTVPTVRARWEQPGWRVLECLLFVATEVHVTATVWCATSERSTPAGRTAVRATVALVATAVAVFGCAVVVSEPW